MNHSKRSQGSACGEKSHKAKRTGPFLQGRGRNLFDFDFLSGNFLSMTVVSNVFLRNGNFTGAGRHKRLAAERRHQLCSPEIAILVPASAD